MNSRLLRHLSGSALILTVSSVPGLAQADALESCGGVFVWGDAECQFVKERECEQRCEVVAVEQTCAAELYTACESRCTAESTSTCTEECEPVCTTECTATESNSEPRNSKGLCRSDCARHCDEKCEGAEHQGRCRSACAHTCNKKCDERCRDDDQTETCEPKCVTACSGKCTATANTECQVDCQATSFERCETTRVEECRTECTETGGAIFCDGQFLKTTSLDACAKELSAKASINLDVQLDVDVDADVDVKGNGDAITDCAMRAGSARGGMSALFLALTALAFVRRRRQPSPRNE